MNEIDYIKTNIIEMVRVSQDADLLDLVMKLLISAMQGPPGSV